jgi:anti-anti-sigma factor
VNNNENDTRSPLEVEVTASSAATLMVSIRGEVDMVTAPRLATALTGAIERHAPRHVVIDAAAVPFLDAAGITAFVAVHRHAADRNIGIRLINVRPLVSTVLHIVELADVFHVTPPDRTRNEPG